MKTRLLLSAFGLQLSALLFPSFLVAQDAAANTTEEQEVVTLDEYQVSGSTLKDSYVAAESVSGTRFADKITNLPFSIEVITDQVVQDFQLFTEQDIAQFIGGSSGDISGGSLSSSNIRIRGFAPLVIRDGFRAAMPSTPSNTLQSEFIKGPLSVLYGRAEPGGFMNRITRRPAVKPAYSATATYGENGVRRYALTSTGPLAKKSLNNKLFYRAYFEYTEREGYYADVDFERGKRYFMGASFLYKFRPSSSLTITAEYQPSHESYSGGIDLVRDTRVGSKYIRGSNIVGSYNLLHYTGDSDSRESQFYGINALFEHRINSNWSHRSSLQTYARDTDIFRWSGSNTLTLYDAGGFNGTFSSRNAYKRDRLDESIAAQAEILGTFRRSRSIHKILAGIDLTFARTDDTEWSHTAARGATSIPGSVLHMNSDLTITDPYYYNSRLPTRSDEYYETTDYDLSKNTVGGLLSYRGFFLRNRLAVMAGMRFEYYEDKLENKRDNVYPPPGIGTLPEPKRLVSRDDGSKLTYSVGANYQIAGEKLLFFASASSGYNPKNIVDGGLNTLVPPQESNAIEFGFKGSSPKDTFGYTVSFYDMTLRNIAVENGDYVAVRDAAQMDIPEYLIAGKQTSRGVDGSITFRPVTGLVFIGTFGYCDNEVVSATATQYFKEGRPSTGVAKWNASLITRYNFGGRLKGLRVGFAGTWRDRVTAFYETTTAYGKELPSVFTLRAFAGYEIKIGKTRHDFALNINNLFDETYYSRSGRAFYGRAFSGTYTLRF